MLGPVEMQIGASIRQAELLADRLLHRIFEQIDKAELFFLTTHFGYWPYAWNRAAMEQLKAAGGLREIRNRTLADRICDCDALTHHLDQDYLEDEQSPRDISALVDELIDLNYAAEGLEDVPTWQDGFTDADLEQRLTRFRDKDNFLRLAHRNRPVLSVDLGKFRRLATMNRRLAESASARPDMELPRLREFAAAIQILMAEEYRQGTGIGRCRPRCGHLCGL